MTSENFKDLYFSRNRKGGLQIQKTIESKIFQIPLLSLSSWGCSRNKINFVQNTKC